MRYFIGTLMLAGLLLSGASAFAQSSRQELGEAVMRESGAEALMVQTIEASGPLIVQSFRASIPDLTEPEGDRIVAYFVEEVRVLMPELIRELGTVYAENFTASELEDILAFYRSPTGQKLTGLQPVLAQSSQAYGERMGEQAMTAAMPRIIELLENR